MKAGRSETVYYVDTWFWEERGSGPNAYRAFGQIERASGPFASRDAAERFAINMGTHADVAKVAIREEEE